ncbi:acetylxylan esterase [Opitutus terrae]|uniref:Acetyl xylan esterase n=1 Tax=Opitutus terrae (strain DSM 11246 / JCM 15787 / PB90-1) TaxID=452637 RepID=B1ZRT3_OPITP|nr:acetylxylan esterase [Opitutus terrae]ACB73776.1 Acetyl xylan esterase [Opitutus terrae PB90-1]
MKRFLGSARLLCATSLALLVLLTASHAAPAVLQPLKASGIYDLGEKAGWTVTMPADATLPTGGYNYTIKKNDTTTLASGPLDPSGGPVEIAVTLNEPAMLFAEVTSAAGEADRAIAGAAVAPTQLQPVVARPADFDAFWTWMIQVLHRIPVEPALKNGESGRDGVEYATIRMNNIDGSHVYGQLAKPAREGKFPALLMLQWAGGPYPLQKPWVVDHAAEGWLALNIEPHDVPGDMPKEFYDALPAMIKSYNTIYNDSRDRNYFLRMYLGAYRAVDYLAGRPDWDGRTLLVTGTSMGGQQSLAVAGLHPQITHVIVHVPAGADANAALHGRSEGYPNWDRTNPKVMETARYFDTVNFAPHIKARSLVSLGFLDRVCPPAGIWTAFNLIAGPKEVVPLVEAAHNHQSTPEQQRAYYDRSKAWMDALVKGQEP